MGGILSKNTKEDQEKKNNILKELELSKTIAESICKKSETRLNEIYENIVKIVQEKNSQTPIFNVGRIKEINQKYNEALAIVDCHNPNSSLYKAKIKTIYQTYLRDIALFTNRELRDIDIELKDVLKDIKKWEENKDAKNEKENKDPMYYGAFINERMTKLNNGINNLEQIQTFYLYDDNFILDLTQELIEDRNDINKNFSKYIGLYNIYKKFILSKYYAIGRGSITTDNKEREKEIKKHLETIQEYFDVDTYKYLMKFSELVPILYPTWPINEDGQYLKFTDINSFYKWVDDDNYFNISSEDVQCRYVYLIIYYSDIAMNKTVPNHENITWFAYYDALFQKIEDMIRNQIIVDEKGLFCATKKIYKLLGINHWKSIKFYANVGIDSMNKNEQLYIPSNYPIFSPKLESLITITYTYNKLIEIYGNKDKKGGRFFEDPNIFHYDDIFYNCCEDPVLIQISQIGKDLDSVLDTDGKKLFAKRLKFYEEVCDNTFAWYAFVNGDSNVLSIITTGNSIINYLELFKTYTVVKYGKNNNNIPDNFDFNDRYDFMIDTINKVFKEGKTNQTKNLNHDYITKINLDEFDFKIVNEYIDNENNLESYYNDGSTMELLLFNLANENLSNENLLESPTDVALNNLIMYYLNDQYTELKAREQAETNNLFGFLSAAYLIGNNISIPNTKIIFELATNCLNSTKIDERNPLADYNTFGFITYLFNYSDYMTYGNDKGNIKIAKLVSYVYSDTLVNNKNFALIIPLYPESILNDNTYYNTINYNDYKTCIAYSSLLNKFVDYERWLRNNKSLHDAYTYTTESDEMIFDNMLQRSTFYTKCDGSF